MSEQLHASEANLLNRIEILKKWQIEQQQRLIKQQSQQSNFLLNEHIRMNDALKIKQLNDNIKENIEETNQELPNNKIDKSAYSFANISNSSNENIVIKDIENIPVGSPIKNFNSLLEEKLKEMDTSVVTTQDLKPKRKFLKKGEGLSRFRMTLDDLAHKKSTLKSSTIKNENLKNINSILHKENIEMEPNENKPEPKTSLSLKKDTEPKLTWKPVIEESPSNYHALLAELLEVRQKNPSIFESPSINKLSESSQQHFEHELLDELKIFETLEQKVSNSSFCSTSSIVTRLMEQPIKSTPQKNIFLQNTKSPSKEILSFMEKRDNHIPFDNIEEETTDQSDEDDSASSSDTNSSVNSDDLIDDVHQSQKTLYKDVATNTDLTTPVTSDLLKTRLVQLENEIETFRSENALVNKLKSQYETDFKNFEKQRKQLEKEIEEQKKQIKAQFEEEKAKLTKDRQVYERYTREVKESKTLRQKDRDEINLLNKRLTSLQEQIKLKESKWGATQARLRNQIRHLEKENAILLSENNELKTKNSKLEATNKQLLSRRPSDTKVLHEINKNLSKLTQETKPIETSKSTSKKTRNNSNHRNRSRSMTEATNDTFSEDESNKENHSNSLNTNKTNETNKSLSYHSFESVEKDYEKMFGLSSNLNKCNDTLAADESCSYSDASYERKEIVLNDGTLQITYPNGNIRTISADGQKIIMKYHNGDIKETCKETGTIRYLYSDANTWHTTYPDGLELLEFENGQIEKRFANGSSEILFTNGCRRCTSPGGTEEVTFPDGTILVTLSNNGEKILTLPNGQKEIHTKDHKRREYPDGTVKVLYPDGIQETRYANGRIRLKDKHGNLIMDSATV